VLIERRAEVALPRQVRPGDALAVLVTVALVALVGLDVHSPARTVLAVAFVFWVPGSAIAAWLPRLTPAEHRGVAVTMSLTVSVLAPTLAVWVRWWHPTAVFGGIAAASVVSLVLAPRDHVRNRRPRVSTSSAVVIVVGLTVAVAATATAFAQLAHHDHVVGEWGLLPQLPVVWFVAVAALAIAGIAAFRAGALAGMAECVVVLVALLHGTTAVAYAVPRFSWTYKHLGVTDYLLAHGHFSKSIDIYHNWPGFFSLAAYLCKVAGVTDPMTLLRWCPAVIGIASVLVLRFFFGALTDDGRILWGSVTIFVVANWIGQDYFSPQSVAFVMGFGVLGLLLRTVAIPERLEFTVGRRERAVTAALALLAFFAVTCTHQLTPYLLLPGIVIASVVGGIRPRWIAGACIAIALAYALPRFGWVRTHGGLGKTSVGDNLKSPAATLTGTAWSVTVSNWASRLLTGSLALASLPYLVRFRRDRWWMLLLVSNLAGPACVLLVQAYGNEGILRTALFATPWMAFSAMSVVVDDRVGVAVVRLGRSLLWGGAALAGVALFALATWGLDARYRVGPDEVRLVRTFEQNAPRGAVLAQLGGQHLPIRMTSRYPELQYAVLTPFQRKGVSVDAALRELEASAGPVARRRAVYVASTAAADELSALFGYGASGAYARLRDDIRHSSHWTLIIDEPGTLLARYRG